MSKHELNKEFFANAKMIHPDNYSGISELFKAWSLASGRANDRTISDANQADAAGKMEEYWDAARAPLPPRAPPTLQRSTSWAITPRQSRRTPTSKALG